MRPEQPLGPVLITLAQARVMEQGILEVRRHWFGAIITELECAISAREPSGELILLVDGSAEAAERLIAGARSRRAFVVVTDQSRPSDLAQRLRRAGYRPVQSQITYTFDPGAGRPVQAPQHQRRGLLALLRKRELGPVQVSLIGEGELEEWNRVCCRAFGSRVEIDRALEERRSAFRSMGPSGRWYLARAGGEPVGAAMCFRSPGAAQVLAVGTLPAYRGRGVASRLMERIIADWNSAEEGLLFLDTAPGSAAERLYQRLGFRSAYRREIFGPGGQ